MSEELVTLLALPALVVLLVLGLASAACVLAAFLTAYMAVQLIKDLP
jgi:hypothetical protein